MSDERHEVRPSVMTMLFAVTGMSLAAFVTSMAALNIGSDETAVLISVVGGTSVLIFAAAVCVVVARRMEAQPGRRVWSIAGLGLALTAAGAGVRAVSALAGLSGPGVAETLYAMGLAALVAAMLTGALSSMRPIDPRGPAIIAILGSVAVTGGYWVALRTAVAEGTAPTGSSLSTPVVAGFLAILFVAVFAAVFLLASARQIERSEPSFPWIILSAGGLAIIAGDLAWAWQNSASTWTPGSLGDFAHISGHVLVAAAALMSADAQRDKARGLTL